MISAAVFLYGVTDVPYNFSSSESALSILIAAENAGLLNLTSFVNCKSAFSDSGASIALMLNKLPSFNISSCVGDTSSASYASTFNPDTSLVSELIFIDFPVKSTYLH